MFYTTKPQRRRDAEKNLGKSQRLCGKKIISAKNRFWFPRSWVGTHMPVCIPTQERGNEGDKNLCVSASLR